MDNLKIIIKSFVVLGFFMLVLTAIATIQVNIRDDMKALSLKIDSMGNNK